MENGSTTCSTPMGMLSRPWLKVQEICGIMTMTRMLNTLIFGIVTLKMLMLGGRSFMGFKDKKDNKVCLDDILSDRYCFIKELPDWIRASMPFSKQWKALLDICEQSTACFGNRLRDYEVVDANADIRACWDTGITHYCCGLFRYDDITVNYSSMSPNGIRRIMDSGWFGLLENRAKESIFSKKMSDNIFEKKAMDSIIHAFEENYEALSQFRDKNLGIVYEQLYKQTNNPFLSYAAKKLRGEELPKNIVIAFPNPRVGFDPYCSNGGAFAIVTMNNDCPVEINECDELGNSIFRTLENQ